MSQTFSTARFGRLLRKFVRDNKTALLAGMGAVLLIILTAGMFMIYLDRPSRVDNNRIIGFLVLLLVLWPLFVVYLATVYNNREQALNALMLPASQFEKWLLLWVVTGLGFLGWYVLCFKLVDVAGTYYVNHRTWSAEVMGWFAKRNEPRTISLMNYQELMRTPIWFVWVVLHPFALAASLLFRRHTLVVGVIVGLVLFGSGLYLNGVLLKWMLGRDMLVNPFPFSGVGVDYSNGIHYLEPSQPLGNIIRWFAGVSAVGLLYAVAYFRLKEREV